MRIPLEVTRVLTSPETDFGALATPFGFGRTNLKPDI